MTTLPMHRAEIDKYAPSRPVAPGDLSGPADWQPVLWVQADAAEMTGLPGVRRIEFGLGVNATAVPEALGAEWFEEEPERWDGMA